MTVPRVRFREGQRLAAQDLQAEQAFLLALARGHRIGLHIWGIVTGLEVTVGEDGLHVSEGIAVDGYGRDLILEPAATIPLEAVGEAGVTETLFDHVGSGPGADGKRRVGIWVRDLFVPAADSGSPSRSCAPGHRSRWVERAEVVVTPWVPGDPRTESSMVLIGAVVEDGDGPALDAGQCLPYVGLVASSVTSSSSRAAPDDPAAPAPVRPAPVPSARIDLARRMGGERRRFAVAAADNAGILSDRLTVDRDGATTLIGAVRLTRGEEAGGDSSRGDLILDNDRFHADDIIDPDGLICRLTSPTDGVSRYVRELYARGLQQYAPKDVAGFTLDLAELRSYGIADQKRQLAGVLNLIVQSTVRIYGAAPLSRARLRQDTWALIRAEPPALRRTRENKLVLADILARHVSLPPSRRAGARALELRPVAKPPDAAKPWSIYRTDLKKDQQPTVRQLRMELELPPGEASPDVNRLQIGCRMADGGFRPCLAVDAGGTTTVHGNLYIGKRLIEGPIEPDPNDPRFLEQVGTGAVVGEAAGIAAVSTIDVAATGFGPIVRDSAWTYNITVTNTGPAIVRSIGVYETVAFDEQVGQPVLRLLDDDLFDLDPGETSPAIEVDHDAVPAGTLRVSIALTAIGAGPGFAMYASVIRSTSVVAPSA